MLVSRSECAGGGSGWEKLQCEAPPLAALGLSEIPNAGGAYQAILSDHQHCGSGACIAAPLRGFPSNLVENP